jgi:hypothetical protein
MSPVLLGEKAAAHDEGAWARHAIELIQNDQRRSADTHLLRFDAPALDGIDIYLKDESTHPTGSLKHRLARSLFLYGICNGRIRHDTPIIEASSGSTAISEAYFARMLGLPFHAVMSASTSQEKVAADRAPARPVPSRRRRQGHLRRGRRARGQAGRRLHGPVHLRRARDRLARQQQHRRIDLRADEPRGHPVPPGSS